MAMRAKLWVTGASCAAYCRLVAQHHFGEDTEIFPLLRGRDARLAAVLDRLTGALLSHLAYEGGDWIAAIKEVGSRMTAGAPHPGSTYVALGSSFAAGPGITPVVDTSALRSGRNYAHQVASLLALELVDVTCSGATTANILTTPQGERPPQLEAVTADAELVTLTAGGNDLRYVGTLFAAGALGTAVRLLPFLSASRRERLGDLIRFRTTPRTAPEAFAAVAGSQAEIVERVRERAPRARVLLIDYLTLLGTQPAAQPVVLTPTQQRVAAEVGQGLAEAFRIAADRSGAELVQASAASVSHGVGSPEPWVYGFELGLPRRGGPTPFHPNLARMTEVARLVVDALRLPAAPGRPPVS